MQLEPGKRPTGKAGRGGRSPADLYRDDCPALAAPVKRKVDEPERFPLPPALVPSPR